MGLLAGAFDAAGTAGWCMARMVIAAAHGLRFSTAARIGAEVLFIQRHCLGKSIFQLFVIVLAVDAEVGVMVDKATKHLLAVFAVGAGIQYVRMPDGIHCFAGHQCNRWVETLKETLKKTS